MLSVVLGLTSCLKDSDSSDVILSNDTAILNFSLTTVNRTMTVKSSTGADSTYKVVITTSLPTFTIDQYERKIYNTTPLPANCDLKHVLASITSQSTSPIYLKSAVSDTLTRYVSTDSLDLSQTRELRVYALDGSGYRAYELTVNMSQESAGILTWEEVDAASSSIPAALYQDFAIRKGEDSKTFSLSMDGGNSWTEELLGEAEDIALLPITDIAWATIPYSDYIQTNCELLAGSSANSDRTAIWRKINEGTKTGRWVNIPMSSTEAYYLPKMEHLNLIWFDSKLLAIGNNGKIYKSTDQGITWMETTEVTLPSDIDTTDIKATTDADGTLWLKNPTTGKVWRGSTESNKQ